MNQISKADVGNMKADLQAALASVAAKYNVTISVPNTTYSPDDGIVKFKVEMVKVRATGEAVSVDRVDLERHLKIFASLPSAFGAFNQNTINDMFANRGTIFQVVGYRRRNWKAPFIIKTKSGQMMKCTEEFIKTSALLKDALKAA